jgi:hypothetical protein
MEPANKKLEDFLIIKIQTVSQEQNPKEKEKINAEIYAVMKKHVETKNKK